MIEPFHTTITRNDEDLEVQVNVLAIHNAPDESFVEIDDEAFEPITETILPLTPTERSRIEAEVWEEYQSNRKEALIDRLIEKRM